MLYLLLTYPTKELLQVRLKKFNITYLKGSSALNAVLKDQKRTKEKISLLYTSLWDEAAIALESKLVSDETAKNKLYVLDTFETPHGTAIFRVNKLPSLITIKDRVKVEDYLPNIYRLLGI